MTDPTSDDHDTPTSDANPTGADMNPDDPTDRIDNDDTMDETDDATSIDDPIDGAIDTGTIDIGDADQSDDETNIDATADETDGAVDIDETIDVGGAGGFDDTRRSSLAAPGAAAIPAAHSTSGSRPRRFHLTHAVFGIVFIALGLFGLDGSTDQSSSWVWVALLAGAGVAGLVAVVQGFMTDGAGD